MKKIFLKLYLGLSLLIALQANANPTDLTGRLTDAKGNPISGAKIALAGKPSAYSVTNKEGAYTIVAEVGDTALVSTSAQFSKKVVLGQQQTIVLGKDASPVIYGTGIVKNNAESTAAVSTVFADRLEKSSSKLNVSNALFGELLGLSVLENSGVNEDKRARFNMRGLGTPMVLVDGFERDYNDLTVEEVESVTLLKDAASLAIYGMRGSNGVILVTSKRGKYNTTEIEASYDRSINFAEPFVPMVNAYDYAMGLNEALANDGLSSQYNNYELNAFQTGTQPLIYPNVNWADETLNKIAHSNSLNMQVRGGSEVVRYFTSIGYDTDKGIVGVDAPDASIPNQFQYSNLNVRSNLDISISKNTLLSINLLGKLKEKSSPMLSATSLMETIYNTPSAAFPVKTENDEWGASTNWTKNPVADLANAGFYKYHTRTLLADFTVNQNLDIITKGLKARVSLAYDSDAVMYERKNRDYRTETIITSFDEDGNPIDIEYNQIGENEGSYSFSHWLSTQYHRTTLKGIIDYNRTFGLSTVSGGYIYELTSLVNKGIQETYNRINNSLFMSYAYDSKYLLDASFTLASSNILNPRRKWGYFPAVSAAWVISNEDVMKENEVVNYLKLHSSVGILGSDNMDFDAYKQEYKPGSNVLFGNFIGAPTLQMGALPVRNLTYAKTLSLNIGLEGTLYRNLNFEVELFHNKVYDILTGIGNINSSVLGVNPGYANDGERTFKGFELGLGYHKNVGDFKYAVNGKFTFNRSKIVNMNERSWKNDFNKATGHSVGQIFGYEAEGFFKDQADIDNSPVHTFSEVQAGDIKYKDQDKNGVIDQYDRVAIGNSSYMPELYFSFDMNMEYRNVGMSFLFQGVGNYSAILNTTSIYRPLVGNNNISQHYYDNRWTATNQDALYPRLTTESNENNEQNSTIWLQDRSYLKLRSAEIYYNLPEQLVNKVKLDNAKIFVRGYNLFSIDKVDLGDPETLGKRDMNDDESTGISYPLYRTINLGVKISF
ncbi:SusC/RagA family TonB-linked outer membrane protein [Draconibacterium mangrovi]|uniref:SusC/RagA family TonB-linked outer membrane protein n=1 Tax=Draconibacterium mangrovi TaxID=2697469 RepID=UPI0013D4A904|nr:SusC/RagA family TonB-linked outer membrane protein [Draconibacterium mangrovi]